MSQASTSHNNGNNTNSHQHQQSSSATQQQQQLQHPSHVNLPQQPSTTMQPHHKPVVVSPIAILPGSTLHLGTPADAAKSQMGTPGNRDSAGGGVNIGVDYSSSGAPQTAPIAIPNAADSHLQQQKPPLQQPQHQQSQQQQSQHHYQHASDPFAPPSSTVGLRQIGH